MTSSNNILKKELVSKDAVIKVKTEEVFSFKNVVEKMREDHINEINNLMKERKKRSSRSNLGSSRSLTSSLKESNGQNTPVGTSSPENDPFASKMAGILPIVKEEMSPERNNISHDMSKSNILEEENEDELARAIYHYDSIIEELRKSHDM